MATVRIVTDSTADLDAALRAEHGIEMVPLVVHIGERTFKDAIEIDPDRLWREVEGSSAHPRTSQPPPADFEAVYRRLRAEGAEVVSIHISSDLSGTLGSAALAREAVGGEGVALVDSRSVSLGLGLTVLEAARRARRGATAAEIEAYAREAGRRTHILFGVDTLEYLARGGRIGRAAALLGTLLNLKPVLQIQDGVVSAADKVRGRGKVLPRCLERMAEWVRPGSRVRMAALHVQAPDEAARWLEAFRREYRAEEVHVGPVGPVVAVHAGPGTVGIVLQEVFD